MSETAISPDTKIRSDWLLHGRFRGLWRQ